MVWPRTIHRPTPTLITGSTRLPPTPHRVDFSAGNDVDRNQTPAAISGGLSSGESPPSTTADLDRPGGRGVALSGVVSRPGRIRATAWSRPPNATPRNRQTTTRPRDPPHPSTWSWSTSGYQPLSPPGRPGRATAAVAAVRTKIDETNARRVPTPPIRRVLRPSSMVVLPYLPSPSPARSPQIRQTGLRLLAFGSIKPDLRFALYPGPATPGRPRKPERPINAQ
jgi:hypothetical protein